VQILFDFDEFSIRFLFASHHESDFEKFIPFLQALTRLSYDNMADAYTASSNVTKETSLEDKELRQLMFSVAIKCEETFAWCRYKDDGINCCDFFLPVYSEHGFCFGFNSRYTDTERAE
jgi:acid-sensing ion channel, other